MIQRTLIEWQRIAYGDDEATIPVAEAARLAAVARASAFAGRGGVGVLDHGRRDLRARGVVGVVAAPGCQLEILPKIEGASESGPAESAVLRHRLVHMLAVARDIPVEAGAMARLGWQRDSVLEIFIRLFCGKLAQAVRQGMPRRYLAEADDLSALRGRLDVTRQFTVLAGRPQKLACRFDNLSSDIALNRAMKAAVVRLARLAQAPDNQRNLRELAVEYADIADVSPSALRWDSITLDRTNERWRGLLALARLLLGERYQHSSAGAIDGHALLFEMHALFEEYVARLMKRALAGSGLRVVSQGGLRACLYDGQTGRFRTRPDILLERDGKTVLIIDTKWKRITPRIDDPKQGVSQADIYQMMAYTQLYDCPRVMLLYPHHHALGPEAQLHRYALAPLADGRRLSVATLDVTARPSTVKSALAALVADELSADGWLKQSADVPANPGRGPV